MSESSLILSNGDTRGVTSPSARLTRVETDLANLRSEHFDHVNELEKLRLIVMPMVTSLATLTVLSERTDRQQHRIIEGIERLSERLAPLVATTAGHGILLAEHINDCERDRHDQRELATERHEETQDALRRMDSRTRRLAHPYYFVLAGIPIFIFLLSDVGQRVMHYLAPVVR